MQDKKLIIAVNITSLFGKEHDAAFTRNANGLSCADRRREGNLLCFEIEQRRTVRYVEAKRYHGLALLIFGRTHSAPYRSVSNADPFNPITPALRAISETH